MMFILLAALYCVTVVGECTDCGCAWANSNVCSPSSDDGSVCWSCCCAPFNPPTPPPSPTAPPPPHSTAFSAETLSTTRYWDCCKPSCAWTANAQAARGTVVTCANDGTVADPSTASACTTGGTSYMCTDQQPFTLHGQRYAFGAANFVECCECLELKFAADTPLADQTIIVQVTNRGDDLGAKHVDVGMPGGGFGIFNACAEDPSDNTIPQFASSSTSWGARYGGLSTVDGCADLPAAVRPGCEWRFADDGFRNADNPPAYWRRVQCPAVLSDISGCSYDAPGVAVSPGGAESTGVPSDSTDSNGAPATDAPATDEPATDADGVNGARAGDAPDLVVPIALAAVAAVVHTM